MRRLITFLAGLITGVLFQNEISDFIKTQLIETPSWVFNRVGDLLSSFF